MITEADIVSGFTWILGRPPSDEELVAARRNYATQGAGVLEDFRRDLMATDEFRTLRLRFRKAGGMRFVELNQPRLVFLHIEKCAGTTLHAMLAPHFPGARICPERQDQLGDWTVNELARYSLFSGHFDLACCRSIPGPLRLLTMLREPQARLLSLYYFWKSHRPHPQRDLYDLLRLARACTAEEFFSHPAVVQHWSIRNAITGQMTRTSSTMLSPDALIMREPEAALELAWRALQGFAAFGIVERFEASRLLFNRVLGLQMQPIAPQQVLSELVRSNGEFVDVPREPPGERLRALLDPLTDIDRVLYARALTLFEQRVAAVEPRADGAAAPPPSAGPDRPVRPRGSLIRQAAAYVRRARR